MSTDNVIPLHGKDSRDSRAPTGNAATVGAVPATASTASGATSPETGSSTDKNGPSQATLLRRLALSRYTFGAAPDGTPFAVPLAGPHVARSLRGGRAGLRAELSMLYARAHAGAVPSSSALADALNALEGEAMETNPQPLALRVAAHNGGLLLDLGRVDGHVAHITPAGWSIVESSPVLFRRTALTSALPDPIAPGDLAPLRELLNIGDADWPLVLAWLVAALIPDLPHPVLLLLGEQGTGKSTATRNVLEVIDPSPAPLRALPRDLEQWVVTASSSWIVGLDNLSGLPAWFSDVLCRAVTGEGMIRRKLFTDDDVSVLSFRRVIAANGIDMGSMRGDIADRALPIELHPINNTGRRTEADTSLTDHQRGLVLGGLFDLTAHVLAVLPSVELYEMPRMADFARIVAALDQVLGTKALDRYLTQIADLAQAVSEGDPFATAIRTFLDAKGDWTGPASDLLTDLNNTQPRQSKGWPTNPRATAAALNRAAPTLRKLGYTLDQLREGHTGRRLWTLAAPPGMQDHPQTSSPPSPPSPDPR